MSLKTNLISYWNLDEASGNALDEHGSHPLTDVNGVGSAAGKINNCRDFENGSTHYFSHASTAALQTGDIKFTVSLWLNMETTSLGRDIISKWGGSTHEYLLMYEPFSNELQLYIAGAMRVAFPLAAVAGTWYHVIFWHDNEANQVGITVNNAAPVTAAYSGGITAGNSAFAIGANPAFTANSFDGLIDEVGFWKRLLTSDERTELFNSGVGLSYNLFGILSRHWGLLQGIEGTVRGMIPGTLFGAGLTAASVLARKVPYTGDFTAGVVGDNQFAFPGILICLPPEGEIIDDAFNSSDDWTYPAVVAIAARDEQHLTSEADRYLYWRQKIIEQFNRKPYTITDPSCQFYKCIPRRSGGAVLDWKKWLDGSGIFASVFVLDFTTRVVGRP